MWKKLHNWLLDWKPIHLCWWYEKHGKPVPRYLVGGSGSPPSVTTNAATNVQDITATLNGNVTSDGGKVIEARGFTYSDTDTTPTIGEGGVTDTGDLGGTTGTYSTGVSSLSYNTTYYYQAYATNSKGTSYGGVQNFTTTNTPTVVLNTPADSATGQSVTPTLEFTGTDSDSDDLEYNVQVDTVNTFDSQNITVAQNTDTTYGAQDNIYSGATKTEVGTSFTGDGSVIDNIDVWSAKNGTPTGNVTVSIYAHTGTYGSTGTPTGSALATSDNLDISTMSTTRGWHNLTFSGGNKITLTNGTNYFWAITYGGGNSSDNIEVIRNTVSGWGGNHAYYSSGSWTSFSTWDNPFRLYGEGGSLIDASSSVPDAGFANTVTPADTHPFNSGEKADYDVQSGDTLDNSTTYYWRARAKDPSGTNTWGAWPTTRSFTTVSGAIDITVQDSTHSHTVDSPAITQTHVITTAEATHGHIADQPAVDGYIGQNYTYEDKATLPTDNTDLASTMTGPEKADVATDNNVYFDLTGSDFLTKQFEFDHDNNTDQITVTWKGKSTLAPTSSTIYLQIYNYITPAWETLQSNNTTAADTEFTLTGSKTASLSNYYTGGNNTVTARVYQQVV